MNYPATLFYDETNHTKPNIPLIRYASTNSNGPSLENLFIGQKI